MFKKILIANRGEIACRVIRTARRLGLRTVAVYSDADKYSLHVSQADQAVCIGPPPANQSYLLIDPIVQACQDTGAEAVHPGYGFLSENAEFTRRLDAAGIRFVGPRPHAIACMGDKVTAKQLAQQAGVNTVPGSTDIVQDPEHALAIAREIGFPVMLKASAGGGGKGMRVAYDEQQCREGFARAASEAGASFGDERVFIEKFIQHPRHIEIQVIGDSQGKVIHLGERECSLQRRHQKVIEEAPSPFLDETTRAAMGAQAVALAKAVEYQSAGTVEFLVDHERNFYFLEMNTRLQVEHPVTEMVTGIDLVELMIRVAAGEPLPISQQDVHFDGWALEARIYAEDPARGFLPSTGRLVNYLPPPESDNVRVDTGVYEGSEVSIHYDPMIAKLITHEANREAAIDSMRRALNAFYIRGVSHNVSFLAALIDQPKFLTGSLSTNLIAETFPEGFHATEVDHNEPTMLVSVAAAVHNHDVERGTAINGQLHQQQPVAVREFVAVLSGSHYDVEVRSVPGGHQVTSAGKSHTLLSNWPLGRPVFEGTFDGQEVRLIVERHDLQYRLFDSGAQVDILVVTPRAAELLTYMPIKEPADTAKFLLSPMPGLLTQLVVDVGDEIKSGERLAIVEAMKMENVLRAERDGRISQVLAEVGASLVVDQPILEFE